MILACRRIAAAGLPAARRNHAHFAAGRLRVLLLNDHLIGLRIEHVTVGRDGLALFTKRRTHDAVAAIQQRALLGAIGEPVAAPVITLLAGVDDAIAARGRHRRLRASQDGTTGCAIGLAYATHIRHL